jgi:LPXTG-site transpeptidase (sortase) family protein
VSSARPADPVTRLLFAGAAVLLTVGLLLGAGAGWDWWRDVHRAGVAQQQLGGELSRRWERAGRDGAAAPAPAAGPALPAETAAADPGGAGPDPGGAGAAPRLLGEPGGPGDPFAARPAGDPALAAEPPGTPLARLHLPRLGLDLVVVEGVGAEQLRRGPGRMAQTAPLGAVGNSAVAGHRYPGVFWDLDRLRPGDSVVVETAERWYVYRVSAALVVAPERTDVLDPRPAGSPAGAERFLTLITCEPVFSTARRLIRHAVLEREQPRSAGVPAELTR